MSRVSSYGSMGTDRPKSCIAQKGVVKLLVRFATLDSRYCWEYFTSYEHNHIEG